MDSQLKPGFTETFSTVFRHELQQDGSKLRNSVMGSMQEGASARTAINVGDSDPREDNSVVDNLVYTETELEPRWIYPRTFKDAKTASAIEAKHTNFTYHTISMNYAKSMAKGFGRMIDKVIVEGALGTARIGENGEETEAFPTDNIIEREPGSTGTLTAPSPITIDTLIEVRRILANENADMTLGSMTMVIGPDHHAEILDISRAISIDYNNQKPLTNGSIDYFMGLNFREITGRGILPKESVTVGGAQFVATKLPVYSMNSLELGVWREPMLELFPRKETSMASYGVKGWMMIGCTRLYEKAVVQIYAT